MEFEAYNFPILEKQFECTKRNSFARINVTGWRLPDWRTRSQRKEDHCTFTLQVIQNF